MDYHVFKKPKIKNGKKIYKWYYYYTQNGGYCYSFFLCLFLGMAAVPYRCADIA